jgi:DNA-binding GntR family transcriptional regulator
MLKKHSMKHICADLRRQIIDRSIPPGTKLLDAEIGRKYNVSRTPIREVFRQLESEELITYFPYKGFIVNTITIEDVDQIYTIRMSLEGLAGQFATPVISQDPNRLKEMEILCKEMERLFKKGDMGGYIKKNREFHSFLWNSSGNKWLIKILENLSSQLNRFILNATQIPNRVEKSIEEHWEIYQGLKARNGKKVEKAVKNHLKTVSEDLKKALIGTPP